MENWKTALERLVGASFVLAGLAKLFGVLEDTASVFHAMARAITGTELETKSAWLSTNHDPVILFVGLVMVATGTAQLLRHPTAPIAAAIQSLMMICFIIFLHRGFPVVFVDGLNFLCFGILYLSPRPKPSRAQ
ncbi:MAG: DUF6041 domain-containing protein [Paracoccaceae bacterium]